MRSSNGKYLIREDEEVFHNWDLNFKRLYPFPGPIDITVEKENIHCFLSFSRMNSRKNTYLPFVYNIQNYRFNITVCEW